ncbi:hypothetical protein BDV93DRAFT_544966 [Ceratobasidium sp. AG-I]|nr:hypothetical protein BDV93DRAFT_544966 [Ceratobasidium sp. AG-I]
MGFIAQAFGNTFWSSSTVQSGVHQNAMPSRKYRPKTRSSNDESGLGVCIPPTTESLPYSPLPNAHKKRRHASPDATFRPYGDVANDLGRSSLSSSSVASDEPLILSSAGAKAKSPTGGRQEFVSEPNRNQSAYVTGTWGSIPQPLPRLQARPPTTNSLDMFERSQLVRRSRKLGAILGETPRLVDVSEDEQGINKALGKLEARRTSQLSPMASRTASSANERPGYRRSLTLGAISVGSNLTASPPASASRRSFLLNDENASAGELISLQSSGASPRFGRSRSSARTPPVLRLSPTPARENTHPYFARRHSSDISIRRGTSLNSVDLNVGLGSGSDISASKVPDSDNNRDHSSTMPGFARSRSPVSYLDTFSLSSKISLNDSDASMGVGVPSRTIVADPSLPPTPTTPLTPVMTQAEDARRKMRKLARHLGESVPVDLVLGNAGGRRAPHDLRSEPAAPQFLRVPAAGAPVSRSTSDLAAGFNFSLAKAPLGHRKAQSVWKGANVVPPRPSRRMVRRASSAEQLRVDTPTTPQMTAEEKARHVHRAMKMLQMFGAPPPHELYTNAKAHSLDLPPSTPFSCAMDQASSDRRMSVNSFKDLAYILDHDNRNSLLALIGDSMLDTFDDSTTSPCVDTFSVNPRDQMEHDEEPFQARRARANKLAKFFGVSYRDLFDAVCADDAPTPETQSGPSTITVPQPAHVPQQHLTGSGSEVMTNNGVKWVEPKSVDEVLDRLRAMKTTR